MLIKRFKKGPRKQKGCARSYRWNCSKRRRTANWYRPTKIHNDPCRHTNMPLQESKNSFFQLMMKPLLASKEKSLDNYRAQVRTAGVFSIGTTQSKVLRFDVSNFLPTKDNFEHLEYSLCTQATNHPKLCGIQ